MDQPIIVPSRLPDGPVAQEEKSDGRNIADLNTDQEPLIVHFEVVREVPPPARLARLHTRRNVNILLNVPQIPHVHAAGIAKSYLATPVSPGGVSAALTRSLPVSDPSEYL